MSAAVPRAHDEQRDLLMRALQLRGASVSAMKPVASGCSDSPAGLVNDDALQLQALSSVPTAYSLVNPYPFKPAIAPHIAARESGRTIDIPVITAAYRELAAGAEKVVVEGVGGWLVPINRQQSMADVAVALDLPVSPGR